MGDGLLRPSYSIHRPIDPSTLSTRSMGGTKIPGSVDKAADFKSWYCHHASFWHDGDGDGDGDFSKRAHKRIKHEHDGELHVASAEYPPDLQIGQVSIRFCGGHATIVEDDATDQSAATAMESYMTVQIGSIKRSHGSSQDSFDLELRPEGGDTNGRPIWVTGQSERSGLAMRSLSMASDLQRRKDSKKSHSPASADTVLTCSDDSDGCASPSFTLITTFLWQDGGTSILRGLQSAVGLDHRLLSTFIDLNPWTLGRCKAASPQDFYDAVSGISTDKPISSRTCSSPLNAHLYPFQQRAVDWMLHREGADESSIPSVVASRSGERHSRLFRKSRTVDGKPYLIDDLQCRLGTEQTMATHDVRGGILAEEMGLGKTVEILSLVCLNRFVEGLPLQINAARPTKATMLVTPNTILQQWKDETSRHAPHLSWTHYKGMAWLSKSGQAEEDAIASFLASDIVFTTYRVLAQEIHFAVGPPDRKLRNAKAQKPRRRSPLVQLLWWRICLDEAQMLENGMSQAATTASLIPRQNSWAVSGTPVRKDVDDLRGLLTFLHYEPYASSPATWRRLVHGYDPQFREHFKTLFGAITLRHTKDKIKNELKLPPQRRIVVTIPFTAVEEQNYRSLFEEMASDCGLAIDGSPLSGLWDPNDGRVIETMRSWLVRLRQTCLHPQVGERNKRALGRSSNAPLRTVAEVLQVMIEQAETTIRSESRLAVVALNGKAHVLANAKDDTQRATTALPHYLSALEAAISMVGDTRDELKKAGGSGIDDEEDEEGQESVEQKEMDKGDSKLDRRGKLRNNLRNALELQHACEFFIGTAYYQIKVQSGHAETDHQWQALDRDERLHYDNAKALRGEILSSVSQQVEKTIAAVKESQADFRGDRQSSASELHSYGGIENRALVDKAKGLLMVLEEQTTLLDKWRSKLAELLLGKLVDKDDEDVTGEEYEESTKQQEEISIYWDAYRALVADRSTLITGQINTLINQEIKTAIQQSNAQDEEDSLEDREPRESRARMRSLFEIRDGLMEKGQGLSLRGLVHEARSLESSLDWEGAPVTQVQREAQIRQQHEAQMVRRLITQLSLVIERCNKVQKKPDKDLDLFRTAMNHRFDFYRQLQQLSDGVRPYKEELDETLNKADLEHFTELHERHEATIATTRAKHRFLLHLREESDQKAERLCVICQSSFRDGVLTVCGHQFCKDCIGHWWRQHHTCPVCKRRLRMQDFHNITYKPRELRASEEVNMSSSSSSSSSGGARSKKNDDGNDGESSDVIAPAQGKGSTVLYSNISASDLNAIQSIELKGSRHSFGTKIDTIARHLLHMRATDPGSKTIIFSQFRDFLEVLSSALTAFSIPHESMMTVKAGGGGGGKSGGSEESIRRFRQVAGIEAFLLDARSDASGLNLVVATSVLLAEPLVNPGVELQAIARVHRIGQTRETRVFVYLVGGTVEESVYQVSVRRRRELMMARSSSSSSSSPSSRGLARQRHGHGHGHEAVVGVVDDDAVAGSGASSPSGNGGGGRGGDGGAGGMAALDVESAERLHVQADGIQALVGKDKAGGENVRVDDLWMCLFGVAASSSSSSSSSF